jgi:gustatory receptor
MKIRKLFRRKISKSQTTKNLNSYNKNVNKNILIVDSWRNPENVDNWLKSFEEKEEFHEEGFHQSITPILMIAQFFGVLPINNIMAKRPINVNFSWKSLRVAYSIFTLILSGLVTVFAIAYIFKSEIMFGKIVYLVFYSTSFLSFVIFFRLALQWKDIMIEWHKVEKTLPKYTDRKKCYQNRLRIRSVAIVILTLSLIEHILSILSYVTVVSDCPRIKNIFEAYMVRSFPMIYYFFPYSVVLSILVKFVHVTSTFIWSFTDLFIILISIGLSSMYNVINEKMLKDKGKVWIYIDCLKEIHNKKIMRF